MENRWKFLYCGITELWGRMSEAGAGKGKTGASTGGERQSNPPYKPEVRSGANIRVAKNAEWLSGKAAIVYIEPVP